MLTLMNKWSTRIALIGLLAPVSVFAQTENPIPLENPLTGVNSFDDLANKIIGYMTTILAPIITIMVLVGAFKMLSAAGNENKFKEGRKTLTYAVIGAAVVLLAQGVSLVVQNFLKP